MSLVDKYAGLTSAAQALGITNIAAAENAVAGPSPYGVWGALGSKSGGEPQADF